MLRRCFAVKLQKCFVDYKTSPSCSLARRWIDYDQNSIFGWTDPLKPQQSLWFPCPTVFWCVCVTLHNVREVPSWTQARAAAGQMKNWGRGSISVISCLCSGEIWCSGVWLYVCVCRFTGVFTTECVWFWLTGLPLKEASGWTWNSWFRGIL